jgi:hypothetical protein
LLKKFQYEDGKLKYHQKIRKKILANLNFLPNDFWNTNPIISGSYAIHLLFKPQAFYDDIDLYFSTYEDYNSAKRILSQISEESVSKNCGTFKVQAKKIQLINKFFDAPENIIYAHDLKNSSICITKDEIYIDDELFNLYYNNLLSIRTTQITQDMNEDDKIKKIGLLYNRVLKYKERYELDLDSDSYSILKDLEKFLQKYNSKKLKSLVIDSNIYYNGTHSPYQNNLMSMDEIRNHLQGFLFFSSQDSIEYENTF